jgi:tetratricopeptide (TPR) repeat protein
MHTVEHEIAKPTHEAQFEDMCANVYGVVFGDPLPKNNGRRGQEQAGVDIFVRSSQGRVGIQSKRYQDGKLRLRHVEEEVGRAERDGSPIVRLIVATTAASDAKLVREVQQLSDAREAAGKFPVEVEFWSEICRHIRRHPQLQRDYAPNSPGGVFDEVRQDTQKLRQDTQQVLVAVGRVEANLQANADQAVPSARPDSLNRLVSIQLDRITELLKTVRYEDAKKEVTRIGSDLSVLDAHQKARWYLQRGLCAWHLQSDEAAASDFLKAYELYPDDDKIAAAQVRGLLLSGQTVDALAQGAQLRERFPQSVHLWVAHVNARLIAGESVSLADVPSEFRDKPEVLQIVSMALQKAGDLQAALELSQEALQLADSGFYVRLAATVIALQAAMADPVKAMHRLLDPHVAEALAKCTASFEPWGEKLLDLQAGPGLEEGVCSLAYALLLTDKKAEARDLLQRAKGKGLVTSRVLRVELDILRELGQRDELLELASAHAEQLHDDALLLASEVGANNGRKDLVLRFKGIYEVRHPEGGLHSATFQALDWVVRWKCKEKDEVLADLRRANLQASQNVELVLAAARIYRDEGELGEAKKLALHAESVLRADSHRLDRLAVADVLFEVQEFSKAAAQLKDFVPPGQLSDLHMRLLDAYLQSGEIRKAKSLLESFPAGWAENDVARSLAMRLGEEAGDWEFAQPLADKQRERFSKRASSWVFSLVVAMRSGKMHQFHQLLAQVPQELEGSPDQRAQIANTEVRYGRIEQGQRRLYRLFREDLDNADAASKYMVGLVAAVETLPNMEDSLERVAAGSCVALTDEFGAQVTFTLDPTEVENLPGRGEFVSASTAEAQQLLGKTVGDVVDLPAGMGRTRRMKVQAISSAYRRLMHLAHECMAKSLKPAKHVLQMSIRTTDTGADFSQMEEMLRQQTEHGKQAFEVYATSPITLSILAKLVGANVIDLVLSWPMKDAPALFVIHGTVDEMQEADKLLGRAEASYVIDSLTLAELVNLECEDALAVLPKVYASTETRDVLRGRLDEARSDRSSGRAIDADGQLGYLPDTDADKARRVQFFERLLHALETYCEVVPAYGPENLPDDFRRSRDVLEDEEYALLLLAAEREATLLTIDGRLAHLGAASVSLKRVWPHAVLHAAAGAGKLSEDRLTTASLRMFVWNRSFTPLRAEELLNLVHIGGPFMQAGLQRFKSYVSSETTHLESVVHVILAFLKVLSSKSISLEAYGEIVEHLCEAALRHPDCNQQGLLNAFARTLGAVVGSSDQHMRFHSLLERIRAQRLNAKGAFLKEALSHAHQRAQGPAVERPVRLKVVKGTRQPIISLNKDDEAAISVDANQPVEAAGDGEPASGATNTTALLALSPELVEPKSHPIPDSKSDMPPAGQ